jgi:hypothetical protein
MPEEVKDEGDKAEDPNKPEHMPIPIDGPGSIGGPVKPRLEVKP